MYQCTSLYVTIISHCNTVSTLAMYTTAWLNQRITNNASNSNTSAGAIQVYVTPHDDHTVTGDIITWSACFTAWLGRDCVISP